MNSLKNYEIIFCETTTPVPKPHLDRSPSHVRHLPNTNNTNSSPSSPNNNTTVNPLRENNKIVSTSSASNLGVSMSATTIQPISHYQQSKSAIVNKIDLPMQRNALSSSTYKKKGTSENLPKTPITLDLTKTPDFSKLKYSPLNVKAKNQANLTSLALKPATVEGKPYI